MAVWGRRRFYCGRQMCPCRTHLLFHDIEKYNKRKQTMIICWGFVLWWIIQGCVNKYRVELCFSNSLFGDIWYLSTKCNFTSIVFGYVVWLMKYMLARYGLSTITQYHRSNSHNLQLTIKYVYSCMIFLGIRNILLSVCLLLSNSNQQCELSFSVFLMPSFKCTPSNMMYRPTVIPRFTDYNTMLTCQATFCRWMQLWTV